MRVAWAAVLVAGLGSPALAQALPTNDPHWIVVDAVDRFIRPGFEQLHEDAVELETAAATLCGEPSEAQLEAVRDGFRTVVLDYSRVEFLRFGPLMEANRAERLFFWPDRKGIALRQVQEILSEYDETATELESLQGKSVAVQGIGALEYVLFGTGAETLATIEADFRCRYAETIAEALVAVSAELTSAWDDPDGIAARMIEPKAEYADYRTTAEALEELVGAMAFGLEALRDQKLLPFIGRDGEALKPKSAPLWRSGMTVPSILAGFEGIATLLARAHVAAGLGADSTIGADATAGFAALAAAGAAVTSPVEQALADPAQKAALDEIVSRSSSLQAILGEELPAAMALSTGFSSLDGD